MKNEINNTDCENLDPETLRFLFDKRLSLFNTRREHEWKIIFGMIGGLGAIDFAIVTKAISLDPSSLLGWWIIIWVLFLSCVVYQAGVQMRNRIDRAVMDELNDKLCNCQNIAKYSYLRIPIDVASLQSKPAADIKAYHYTFLWAFILQVIVLLFVSAVSCFIPKMVKADKQYTVVKKISTFNYDKVGTVDMHKDKFGYQ